VVKADQGEVAAASGAVEEEADLDRACAACVDDAGGECAACADDGDAVRGCERVRGYADPKEGTPSTPPSTPRQRMCPSLEVNR